jgi:hypothetical protein
MEKKRHWSLKQGKKQEGNMIKKKGRRGEQEESCSGTSNPPRSI